MLRPPRDHDIVEDCGGRLYTVVGNVHPPNKLVAYVKYIPVDTETPWRRGDVFYERVLRTYGVKSMHKTASMFQGVEWDPVFNTYIPVIRYSQVSKYYYPEVRLWEIISRASDDVEVALLTFIDVIRGCMNVTYSSLGITGSLLPKIHNPKISDLDVVIYGCREAREFVESCINNFKKVVLDNDKLVNQSRIYGISTAALRKILAPYKKLLVNGREANVLFVDNTQPKHYGSEVYLNLHPVELEVTVYGGDCRALFYPCEAVVERFNIVRPANINLDGGGIASIISYEGLYSYALYRGGKLRVRGLLQKVIPINEYRVIIGALEEPGYAIPI